VHKVLTVTADTVKGRRQLRHSTLATMDVVLEVFDTIFFDRVYAALFPTGQSSFGSKDANATASPRSATSHALINDWQYEQSTQYLRITPSKWAYMTSWPRDDPLRQLVTLYLITWCVPSTRHQMQPLTPVQDLWHGHLLRLRFSLLQVRLRQGNQKSPQIP